MKQVFKLGVLAIFLGALLAEQAPAQRAVGVIHGPNGTVAAGRGPFGWGAAAWGNGWGWGGGGWGWGGGGWGWGNPYNPYSWRSPFNPYSPVSPYNPYSFNNPYNNSYMVWNYNNNPWAYAGLYSWNPYVRAQTWANASAVSMYDWNVYNNYAYMYNTTAAYNAIASTNYATAAYNTYASLYNTQAASTNLAAAYINLASTTAYMSMAAANNNVMNPYAQQGGGYGNNYSSPYAPGRPQQNFGGGQVAVDPFAGVNPYTPPPKGPPGKKPNFEMYAKVNTPNVLVDQAKEANQQVKQAVMFANPLQIVNGSALNTLLDDMRKKPIKKVAMEPINLSEDILRRINVYQNAGNLGLVRDDGKLNWPVRFLDVLTPEEQNMVDVVVRNTVLAAARDKIEPTELKKWRQQVEMIKNKLVQKINDIPTMEYLECKRFLSDLDDARVALERNEAPNYFKFQKFVANGKSVQEVVEYMIANGMKFAAATSRDEGSYRALHSAMAALDMAVNAQFPGPPVPE